jgi:PAS domain S-box-containing protein
MPQLDLIPLRFKIKAHRHLLTLTLLLVSVVVAVAVVVFESRLSEAVMTDVKTDLQDTGEQIERQIQERLTRYRNDVRFLHATPPVSGLPRALNNAGIDPKDNTSDLQWKRRLETIFVAFLQNNIEYQQLRIVSTSEQGMELVRVDRIGGEIKVVEDLNLQSKSDRDYFISSALLSDREVYMSSISLNREFGKIEFPYRPMLRLSLPIFDEFGQRFGFLIVNINAEKLLDSLTNMVISPNQLMLTDTKGYFLITPNEKHKYSRDLDRTKIWNKNFQTINKLSDDFSHVLAVDDEQLSYFSFIQKIVVSGDLAQGYVLAKLLTPQRYVNDLEMERRVSVYTFLTAITIILLVVLSVFNRSMKRNQQLSEAKAESAAIVGSSQDAIIGINNQGVVTSWNVAAESLFEYSEEFAKGKTLDKLEIFEDLILPEIIEKLVQSNTQQNTEITIIKDHEPVYLYLSFSAITDLASDVNGVAIIVRDITKEHIADVKIKRSNAELEEKVACRTIELQKNSLLKSAFISNISHEMRTPLNGIIGTLKLVKNESLSDSQKRYLEMTEVSVNNLSSLINDVLDLSKIEAGKLDIDFQAFNPIQLIQNLCCNMAIKAQEKGLEFVIDVTDLHCQSIVTDAHRFSQILSNLISNAIKFTENGYVKVSASTEFCDDGQLILHCSVSDSGVGIAEHNQEKMFTAFSQEYTAVASKYGGTGLGLAICRQLVGLLNGEIDFTSEKDKGSTFSFSITIGQLESKETFFLPSLKRKSALILISHQELHQSLQRMLQSCSGEILEHERYEQWLDSEEGVCPDMCPDFIIIDQQDPKLMMLDSKWSQMDLRTKPTPKVFTLKKSGDTVISLKNIVPITLDKPVLLDDILQKGFATAEGRPNSKTLQQVGTQQDGKRYVENVSKITGARILVVDDNEINVEVAKGMLSSLPIEIDQAINGQEALDKLQTSIEQDRVFHCILMDCQMPVLNGYDTSQKIREGVLGNRYRNIPIIAMTANAMLGEREKCLAAGMNDYTTKPIDIDTLISKVCEWTLSIYQAPTLHPLDNNVHTASDVSVDDTSNQSQQSTADNGTSETLIWDKRAALIRLMNNETLLLRICKIFMESSPQKIEELGRCITENNAEKTLKLTHSLKGSAGDLGAVDLHRLFSSMEQAAKSPDMQKVQQYYETVLTSYAAFISMLKQEVAKEL